jgi:hypothetical protein
METDSRVGQWLTAKDLNDNPDLITYTWEDLMKECRNFKSREDFREVCAKNLKLKIYFNEFHEKVECSNLNNK